MPPARHHADASRLNFGARDVVIIVVTFLGAYGTFWATQRTNELAFAALDTKVQLVLKDMESARREADLNAKAASKDSQAVTDSMSSISKRQELQGLQIAALEKSIILLTSQGRK